MQIKKITVPFHWEERAPVFKDHVLYVPKYYEHHDSWNGLKEFQDALKGFPEICVEYCSGTGAWIGEKARKNPQILWLAVEKRFDRVRKIWEKIEKFSLANLLVVWGDALTFARYYLPESSVLQTFINFPDPWPKDRHAKHRLVQSPFVLQMARIAKDTGSVTLVTDDEPYSSQMIEEMMRQELWWPDFAFPYYVTQMPFYGSSYFEELWKGKGRQIRYMKFNRTEKLWHT